MKKLLFLLSISSLLFISCETENDEWISLFDGNTLDGWEIKIKGYELNNNYRNTFSVKDESIIVSYDNYDSFGEKFGHLFYTKQKFKNYHLKLDYRFYGEHANGLKNEKYTIAMARTSVPDSATSQFFINTSDNSFLDYPGQDGAGYCVFGKVIEGTETIDKINSVQTGSSNGHQDVPIDAVIIEEVSTD